MIVMLANNTGVRVGYMAGRFPGRIGHLYSPGSQIAHPLEFIPYALDNDRFNTKREWTEERYFELLDWAKLSGQNPRWALVPDVVGDRAGTLADWCKYAPRVAAYSWPLAFAVQDGMQPWDVPSDAQVVFVGGSTEWKWGTMRGWCESFDRVHVGRVNTYIRLWDCHDAGAESVDGTGWMRGDQVQYRGLMGYFEESSGLRDRSVQEVMF